MIDFVAKAHNCRPIAGIKFISFSNKFRSSAVVNDPLVKFENVFLTALLKETSEVDLDEW